MDTTQNRFVYLDNIRNFLVYNVVLLHTIGMFTYPLQSFWPVLDKGGSSRFYEIGVISMNVYLMPCLLFIAALFYFSVTEKSFSPSVHKKKISAPLYAGHYFCLLRC